MKPLFIALGILILFSIWAKYSWLKLEKKHIATKGIITRCYWGGRGTPRYIVDYKFFINEKEYKSTYQLSCQSLDKNMLIKKLVGLEVPVIYNPDERWNNTILIEEKSFARYNIPMPDSLKPVSDFLACD